MKFSVLVAHYNNWDYFQQCYQSLKQQTVQTFDIVILDDYSTDGSFLKLEELAQSDSSIRLFQNDMNQGVGYTKKKLIDLAQGEICGFLDPDDALAECAIEDSLAEYIGHSDCIATYSQIMVYNKDFEPVKYFEFTKKIKNGDDKFLNINFEVAHFFTFKKSVYALTEGINTNLTSAVDQDLYLKLYEKGPFYYINKPLYQYRIHEHGVSQNKSKKTKLNLNWHQVIFDTLKRRKITHWKGKAINDIESLPKYIRKHQYSIFQKLLLKLK